MVELLQLLQNRSTDGLLPWSAQQEALEITGKSLAEIELLALENGLLPGRYQRNGKMLSCADQLKLFRSCVAVVGCGGLGGYVLEMLARIGVGHLIAIDPDVFEEHNLNRQLLATLDNLGMAKVEAARLRIAAINPAVTLTAQQHAFSLGQGGALLGDVQIVVDCLDSPAVRFELAESCSSLGLPLVHGAISGWYGHVCTLRPGSRGLERFYRDVSQKGGSPEGNPSFTPAHVASLEVAEVVKLIIGRGRVLDGEALNIDLLDMEMTEIPL